MAPGLTLWGGIPQDYLLATHTAEEFEAAVAEAARQAASDGISLRGLLPRRARTACCSAMYASCSAAGVVRNALQELALLQRAAPQTPGLKEASGLLEAALKAAENLAGPRP